MEREHTTEIGPPGGRTRALRAQIDRGELAAVFAGGFVGAVLRAALVEEVPVHAGEWPWATFTVNVAGALLLGILVTRLRERPAPSRHLRALLGSGLCGALTTFSTMMVELLKMIDGAYWALAGGYTVASIGCGLVAILLPARLARAQPAR